MTAFLAIAAGSIVGIAFGVGIGFLIHLALRYSDRR